MEIHEASESDIPEIVDLLKRSLGEDLMPKSERYWRWKHIENPFGISPVLLCREAGELIGVRAFMRWEWTRNGETYRALRAVDTATHPDHQGKGIFKKLTLALADQCTEGGDHFVFNTPNSQSKPGYLKMGWEEVSRLPVRINVQRPIRMMLNMISRAKGGKEISDDSIDYYISHPNLGELINDHHRQMSLLVTRTSVPYLSWRYKNVPVANYVAIGEERGAELNGLIIGRIKQTRFGKELRITDHFLKNNNYGKELTQNLKRKIREWRIDYVTLTGTKSTSAKKLRSAVQITTNAGPIVTIRSLSLADLQMLRGFNQWSPSLGDLELF
jgi:N-acetylglutamate synthase-like GNAT family acetyltransferase